MKAKLLLPAALLFHMVSHAQKNVSTQGNKYVLLESSMSAKVPYCPDADVKIDNIISSIPHAVCVGMHSNPTGFKDSMYVSDATAWESAYINAFPAGTIDRTLTTAGGTSLQVMRNNWTAAIYERLSSAPGYDITMSHSYNPSSRLLTVNLTGKALQTLTGIYNFNIYIIEDSVSGTGSGYDQLNGYNTQTGHPFYSAGNPITGYKHRQVLRAMLGGTWGIFAVTDPIANSSVLKTFAYSIPVNYNLNNVKIIGLVSKYGTFNSDRTVQNAIQAKLALCNAAIVLVSDSTGCLNNNNFILSDSSQTVGGTYTRLWDLGNGSRVTSSTANVVYGNTGVHNIKLKITGSNGCQDSSSITVRVKPKPTAGAITGQTTIVDKTIPATYTISQQLNHTYNWSITNGNIVSGQGTNTVSVQWLNTGNGKVLVSITNNESCSDTSSIMVNITSTGLSEISNMRSVSVYPNPASDKFIIAVELTQKSDLQFILSSLLGKEIWKMHKELNDGTHRLEFRIGEPAGIYFLSIGDENRKIYKRIIIE